MAKRRTYPARPEAWPKIIRTTLRRMSKQDSRPGSGAGSANPSPLHDYTCAPFTALGKTKDVYRIGDGPAVIVISEIPGITPKVAEFGRRVASIGCTSVLPHLFGKPGAEPTAANAMKVGATVEEQFKNDLQVEYDAVKRLNDGIKLCVAQGDNASRDLAEHILTDEEEHIDWLEAQLHAISEMGIGNYLAEQLKEDK